MRMLSEVITELQEIYDEVGECKVSILNDLNTYVDDITVRIGGEYDDYYLLGFESVS